MFAEAIIECLPILVILAKPASLSFLGAIVSLGETRKPRRAARLSDITQRFHSSARGSGALTRPPHLISLRCLAALEFLPAPDFLVVHVIKDSQCYLSSLGRIRRLYSLESALRQVALVIVIAYPP